MNILPHHVAVIPDGNRRWAKERNLPTIEGHRRGFDNAVKLAKYARELHITTLTLWAFSTENWDRTKDEIGYLMRLYEVLIDKNLTQALKDNVRIIHLGRKDRIADKLLKKIIEAEEKTKHFTTYYLNIALDYGGRDEIVRAVNKTRNMKHETRNITEKEIEINLDLANQPYPEPDVIIRTGSEMRLSGFLLWQSQYSELFFPDNYFPDFKEKEFKRIIEEYGTRQRRFGK